jgi:hypothetical protein
MEEEKGSELTRTQRKAEQVQRAMQLPKAPPSNVPMPPNRLVVQV